MECLCLAGKCPLLSKHNAQEMRNLSKGLNQDITVKIVIDRNMVELS
jgi:hypothetical protein